MKRIAGIVLAVIGTASVASGLMSQRSLGIIGGQDGPTAVYVCGNIGGISAALSIAIGIALFSVGAFLVAKKK